MLWLWRWLGLLWLCSCPGSDSVSVFASVPVPVSASVGLMLSSAAAATASVMQFAAKWNRTNQAPQHLAALNLILLKNFLPATYVCLHWCRCVCLCVYVECCLGIVQLTTQASCCCSCRSTPHAACCCRCRCCRRAACCWRACCCRLLLPLLLLAFCFIAACAGVSSFAACFDDSSRGKKKTNNDNNSIKFSVSSRLRLKLLQLRILLLFALPRLLLPHTLSLFPFSVCLHFCCCFRLRLLSGLTLSILLSLSTVIVWRGKEREMLQVALRCQLPPDCAVVVLHIHLFGSQGHHRRRRHQQQQQQMRQQQPHRERQQQQRHCNGSHHHLHMLHFIYCSVSVCCRVFLRRITTATPTATTVNCI